MDDIVDRFRRLKHGLYTERLNFSMKYNLGDTSYETWSLELRNTYDSLTNRINLYNVMWDGLYYSNPNDIELITKELLSIFNTSSDIISDCHTQFERDIDEQRR